MTAIATPAGPAHFSHGEPRLRGEIESQRKNVKYVATLSHYIGAKAGPNVPFADEDYRGTDYLGGLAAGGGLAFRGVTELTPRRSPTAELLDQGDYLLWVQLNLDCGPAWLAANDFDTCWGNPDDTGEVKYLAPEGMTIIWGPP